MFQKCRVTGMGGGRNPPSNADAVVIGYSAERGAVPASGAVPSGVDAS